MIKLHKPVSHNVFIGEVDEFNTFEFCEYSFRFDQAAAFSGGQVYLRHVARDHCLRAEADAREKHVHLFARRVLCFVEDDERV